MTVAAGAAHGQAMPTASRAGDLQVGGGFAIANPDYSPHHFKGGTVYADFDFKTHWGVEADFHQVNEGSSPANERIYERTYEIGGRYLYPIRRFFPYVKFMIGRGVFNFPLPPGASLDSPHPNLAYNLYAPGVGVDYRLRPSINLRVDYEYQRWPGFPPEGLQPSIFTIGAAYHFH
jgi:hypothetical protein